MIEQRCLIPWDDSVSKKSAVTRTATYLVEEVGGLSSVVVENLWSLKKKKIPDYVTVMSSGLSWQYFNTKRMPTTHQARRSLINTSQKCHG